MTMGKLLKNHYLIRSRKTNERAINVKITPGNTITFVFPDGTEETYSQQGVKDLVFDTTYDVALVRENRPLCDIKGNKVVPVLYEEIAGILWATHLSTVKQYDLATGIPKIKLHKPLKMRII